MILDLAAHYAEGVVARMVVDVDSAEARGSACWDPLLVGIVVHHDGGSRLADTLFTAGRRRENHDTSGTYGNTIQSDCQTHISTELIIPKEHVVLQLADASSCLQGAC